MPAPALSTLVKDAAELFERRKGRPTDFNQSVADRLIVLLSHGWTMRRIERVPGMPDRMTVFDWLERKDAGDFPDRYRRAMNHHADVIAEEVREIADNATDRDSAAAARVRCEARRWAAAVLNRPKYGNQPQTAPGQGPTVFVFPIVQAAALPAQHGPEVVGECAALPAGDSA